MWTPIAKESSITEEFAVCYERFGEWKSRWTISPDGYRVYSSVLQDGTELVSTGRLCLAHQVVNENVYCIVQIRLTFIQN